MSIAARKTADRGFPFDPGASAFALFGRSIAQLENASFPPYNIVEDGDADWTLELAVAGFQGDDLSVSQEGDRLIVEGRAEGEDSERGGAKTYLHRGIARRSFRRTFALGAHIKVGAAQLRDGMLRIQITRDIPEAARPRQISIASN